jgi:hypothetical protein
MFLCGPALGSRAVRTLLRTAEPQNQQTFAFVKTLWYLVHGSGLKHFTIFVLSVASIGNIPSFLSSPTVIFSPQLQEGGQPPPPG